MEVGIILAFLFFMFIFAGVGMASIRVKEDTTDDYLVAGRGMHPALAALSAVSTWNSGYMFIGFIGFMWTMGYSAIWISAISTLGQLVAWVWLYARIQDEGRNRNIRSLSSLVAKVKGAPEAKFAALASVFFLLIYAAAQLSSGGKALYAMLGWSEFVGILIGFVLVVAYCYAGGIRASIWTDAAQSCVMIVGSTLLCWVALDQVGGFSGMHNALKDIDPALVSVTPPGLKMGLSMWIFAFFLGGLGVAGQPQVVSRIMTLDSDEDRKQACLWFFVWQTPFLVIMVLIGLAARVIFPEQGTFDPELALPMLAMDVLGPFWVGLILASIFAATMSTADSQVLACTAAITDDIMPEWSQDHLKTKLTTIAMALVATGISLFALFSGNNSVFSLVVLAVYGLGGMFIPLLIIRFTGYDPSTRHSIIMMICALTAVIIWRLAGLNVHIFESVPGVGAAFIAHFIMVAKEKDPWLMDRLPGRNQVAAGFAVLLLLILPTELYYLNNAPDAAAGGNDNAGNWTLEMTLGTEEKTLTTYISSGSMEIAFTGIPYNAGKAEMFIHWDETNEGGPNPLGTACDEVTISNSVEGVDDFTGEIESHSSTNCGTEFSLGFIELDPRISAGSALGSHEEMMELVDNFTTSRTDMMVESTMTVDARVTVANSDDGEEVNLRFVFYSVTEHTLQPEA